VKKNHGIISKSVENSLFFLVMNLATLLNNNSYIGALIEKLSK
jgi:hypothetical protein